MRLALERAKYEYPSSFTYLPPLLLMEEPGLLLHLPCELAISVVLQCSALDHADQYALNDLVV